MGVKSHKYPRWSVFYHLTYNRTLSFFVLRGFLFRESLARGNKLGLNTPGQVRIFIPTLTIRKVNMVSKLILFLYFWKFFSFFCVFSFKIFQIFRKNGVAWVTVKMQGKNRIERFTPPRLKWNIVLNVSKVRVTYEYLRPFIKYAK